MITNHEIIYGDARSIESIKDNSVDLIVTSPPYPMIQMWDELFSKQNLEIKHSLNNGNNMKAFELIHKELDKVWSECYRVLKSGGIICINIGDATRTINKNFQLYSNNSRIINYCTNIGLIPLPKILWRKTTNAPNKFMGSGMLPPGAYVTLEHEYLLLFRKGNKREFNSDKEKQNRRESSYFWEERNIWFSDLWEKLNGTTQKMEDKSVRERSAAYPLELVNRIVKMFSVRGDVVLDPFLGTGTSTMAAMLNERNSIGIEIDPNFKETINNNLFNVPKIANKYNHKRIQEHLEFVKKREKEKSPLKYENYYHKFKVMTKQEIYMKINKIDSIEKITDNKFRVTSSYESLTNFV
jgi:DNA modification methylase